MLVKLGLPDTKGWKYISGENLGMGMREIEGWKRTGNAWIEPAADGVEIRKLTADGLTLMGLVEFDRRAAGSEREEAMKKMRRLQATGLQPWWRQVDSEKEGDEAKDAASLIEALKADFAKGHQGRSSYLLRDSGSLASLFFHAAHWHRRGLPKEAAELIEVLGTNLPRKQALLESALRSIANQRVQASGTKFAAGGDWAAYQTELGAVLADFPRAWPERPAVQRIHEMIEARTATGVKSVVGDGSFPLTAEQVAWWDAFGPPAEEEDEDYSGDIGGDLSQIGRIWISNLFPREESGDESEWYRKGAKAQGIDVTNGWNWLEVMAAALGDETLVHMGPESYYRSFSSSSWTDMESEPVELEGEDLEQAWQNMARPRSRDELARTFLKGVVPQPEDSDYEWWESAETEEISDWVKQWSEKLKGKSGAELVNLYFEEGDENWKEEAATIKVRTGTDEEVAQLAELVLASPGSGLGLAQEIVRRRGPEGRPFFDQFVTRLKEEITKEEPDLTPEQVESRFENNYGSSLEGMETLLSGVGFSELFADFVAGESDMNTFSRSMQNLGTQKFTREEVEAAFAGTLALDNPTPERRGYALTIASHVASLWAQQDKGGGEDDATDTTEARDWVMPDWLKGAFGRIIAEGGEAPAILNGSKRSLSQGALYLVDLLVNPEACNEAATAMQGLPDGDAWAVVEARGKARMAGENPPPTPSAGDVPEERKAAIGASLAGVAGIEGPAWDAMVAGLSIAERIVLRDALTKAEPDPAMGKLIFRIARVSGSEAPTWKSLEGKSVDEAQLSQIFGTTRSEMGDTALEAWLNPQPLLGGYHLKISTRTPAEFLAGNNYGAFRGSSEDETAPGFTALAAFECYRSNSGFASIQVRDAEGAWAAKEGNDLPQDLRFGIVRGQPMESDTFSEELATALEEWEPDGPGEIFRFVAFPYETPKPGSNR